ncbi:MAG: aminoacyltransferase [Ruminococcaceae bacterium]|nr:aminoacyltransferase [Oscillospiraceae bacterium]
MYKFEATTDFVSFDKFVEKNKGAYQQCSVWPNIKTAWKPHYYTGFCDDEIVLTALVLERKLPLAGKLWYIPCGAVCDYENAELVSAFTAFIESEMKKHGAFCVVIDPLIPLRIDNESQEKGLAAHKLLTSLRYKLNTDLDSYTYKHPVQIMIPIENKTAEEILKSCEKGVRYSVRVGANRGLTGKRYIADKITDEIIEEFMSAIEDVSNRNSFVNREAGYIKTLINELREYTDITIVYYDKAVDTALELERQAKKAELLSALKDAPQKKIRGLENEITTIDKNTESYNARMEETADFGPEDKIAVAAGLTIRYGGVASCIFGGSRNLLRNNTRSSHFLNFTRICESVDSGMDFHDLGYVLSDNPNPPLSKNGTLGKIEPRENFVGISDFKMSFGAKYYEFIGEYILIGNAFRYWLYKELMPIAKKIKMKLVRLFRNIKK